MSRLMTILTKWLCAQRRLRSAWASAQSGQRLRLRSMGSYSLSSCGQQKLSSAWASGQRRLWSDWAHAQADLSLRWAHMPFCWFVMRRLKRAGTRRSQRNDLRCPSGETLGPWLPIKLWSDCTDVHADLSLRWVQTWFCRFLSCSGSNCIWLKYLWLFSVFWVMPCNIIIIHYFIRKLYRSPCLINNI